MTDRAAFLNPDDMAALAMLGRRDSKNKRATVGADKGYDSKAFVKCAFH